MISLDEFPMRYSELLFGATGVVMCVTIWAVIKIGAWLLSVYPVRAEAVVEWQDCDVKDGPEWDVHVDTALDILLTHEATPDIDQFGDPERWEALEEEFADLDPLAAELGERAS